MISQISGTLMSKCDAYVVVGVGGVGYQLFISKSSLSRLPSSGDEVSFFTHLHVREDAMQLYGFSSEDERELFLNLISISKIGPKVALAILSSYSAEALRKAIIRNDVDLIRSIPGVGKKTAERLILELKEKLTLPDLSEEAGISGEIDNSEKMAREALINLGFTTTEVVRVLEKIDCKGMDIEDIVKSCLKALSEAKSGR